MPSKRLILSLENCADIEIADLDVLKLPIRAFLTRYYALINNLLKSKILYRKDMRPQGEVLVTRLSLLLPFIHQNKDLRIGKDAEDSICSWNEVDPDGQQFTKLLNYVHFCNYMPEVHRDYYIVHSNENQLLLDHKSQNFADSEAKDIILSELALLSPKVQTGAIDQRIIALATSSPVLNIELLAELLVEREAVLLSSFDDPMLISEKNIPVVFKLDSDSVRRIQRTIMSLAQLLEDLSTALAMLHQKDPENPNFLKEFYEWSAVAWSKEFFFQLISKTAKVPLPKLEHYLSLYAINCTSTGQFNQGGDGYFPPFAIFDDLILFSPHVVLSYLHLRNALYEFSKRQPKKFDKIVSHDLEPSLLQHAEARLPQTSNWLIAKNVNLSTTEIDFLIFDPQSLQLLIIEAKGPLPPQGARSTARLGERMKEGLRQLAKLQELDSDFWRQLVTAKFKIECDKVEHRLGLLSRSCFGCSEAYDEHGFHRLTLPLLQLATNSLPAHANSLFDYLDHLSTVEAEIYQNAKIDWRSDTLEICGTEVSVPTLHFDQHFIEQKRSEALK